MINSSIKKLVQYGIEKELIAEHDKMYVTNLLLDLLKLKEYVEDKEVFYDIELEKVLKEIDDYAVESGIIEEDSTLYRDLFDTKVMGMLTPRPSEFINKFENLYKESPEKATAYFYKMSCDSDYIRTYRIKKDIKWKTKTAYGDFDITINLSKPEKDAKAIAAAKSTAQIDYPKCLICAENEGYAGRANHPARQNLRIIPVTLNNQNWGFQYSPYVYYNEHCIILNDDHVPMKVDEDTLIKLLDFIKMFPHYFIGSNAGLPIVGGSILTHEHFQGGNYDFAMAKADIEEKFVVEGYEDIEAGILNWPMSVIRIKSKDDKRLIALGSHIMDKWHEYTDKDAFIFAETNREKHNAITPIARTRGDFYELDLVLRNNITTDEFPDGVFHPHKKVQHIKKENIGLIEVLGLAVLPPRLKEEMNLVKSYILENKDMRENEKIEKHAAWGEEIKKKHENINESNIDEIIKEEIGQTFLEILHDAGVFKRDEKGKAAFRRFIREV